MMNWELHEAWQEVLFWAKRLTYYSADRHPEWKEKYEKAKKHLNEVRQKASIQ